MLFLVVIKVMSPLPTGKTSIDGDAICVLHNEDEFRIHELIDTHIKPLVRTEYNSTLFIKIEVRSPLPNPLPPLFTGLRTGIPNPINLYTTITLASCFPACRQRGRMERYIVASPMGLVRYVTCS
ncbi:hypothetical protein AERO8C_90076 [Aeromonas veronii]|uniref:Uncharacterized protein n=1 Tax=Aeromonas veronii TaxID=654 RepID=A0A653LER8_AERVE|nr:hypothetical protein AERO8C_90076 [Aeromonas veronii]